MKLLLDAMWPPEMAAQLRARGHDVIAVVERIDLRTASDRLVFAAAQLEQRAIVTEDPDFRSIAVYALIRGDSHHGLVFTNPQRFPRDHGGTLGRVLTALSELLSSSTDLRDREYWLS